MGEGREELDGVGIQQFLLDPRSQEEATGSHAVALREFVVGIAERYQFAVGKASDHGRLRVFGAPNLETELADQPKSLGVAHGSSVSQLVFDDSAPKCHPPQDARGPGLPQDVQAMRAVKSAGAIGVRGPVQSRVSAP